MPVASYPISWCHITEYSYESVYSQPLRIDTFSSPNAANRRVGTTYRMKFQRDIYKRLSALEKTVGKGYEGSHNLDLFSQEMFENIAYIMAKKEASQVLS